MEERGKGPLIVIDIEVPEPELVRRLAAGGSVRQCGDERAIRSTGDAQLPPCGGLLVQRNDDNDEVVRERLRVYQRATEPLVEYYEGGRHSASVNGAQPPEKVARELDALIETGAGGTRARWRGAERDRLPVAERDRRLRRVNQLVARCSRSCGAMVAPGVTTAELDALAESAVRAAGAEPAFKGYHGYPATICASVNEQVVHGIPSAATAARRGHRVDRYWREARRLLRRRAVTVPVGRVAADAASCCG